MGFSRQEYWSGLPLPSPLQYLYFPRYVAIVPGRRRGARLLLFARSGGRNVLANLAHELVLLPVLALVLLAAVEGAAAAATAQQVLHLPAQLAVLPVSLARARPAGPAAVIGHGGKKDHCSHSVEMEETVGSQLIVLQGRVA